MALDTNSEAAVVGVSVDNVQFAPVAQNVPRKIVVIGTYNSSVITTVDENVPVQVLSPEDAANRFGSGFMLHRLVRAAWKGANGIPVYCIPQAEPSGAQAEGTITITGSATYNSTLNLYISGERVPVTLTKADAATAIAAAIVSAINAKTELPVTAANTAGEVTVTAKTTGTYGNEIDISFDEGVKEEMPAGVTAVVVGMSSGSGTPSISTALAGMGSGSSANEDFYTELVHGYLQDSTTLDAISVYNGEANEFAGCYAKTVTRPLRSLVGDTAPGTDGYTPLTDSSTGLGPSRKLFDRTNGCIAVPGSPNHPAEIAATVLGIMARINNNRGAEGYVGQVIPGVIPGARATLTSSAGRWTDEYDSRDGAVKAGISPTVVEDGAVKISNVLTFYRPSAVPAESNIYKDQVNISKVQNILYNLKLNFSTSRWRGVFIVEDITKVDSALDGEKVVDTSAVTDDLLALADLFEGRGWIYTAAFTKERLKQGLVVVRAGGAGFDARFPAILSGNMRVLDLQAQLDTSLAALDQ